MINKQQAYFSLVNKRKLFRFTELLNPSEIENGQYDGKHVELWAQWLGCLDAKIMLVGKDFGGLGFFLKFKGKCDPYSVTNQNLMKLFSKLDIDIGTPIEPNKNAPVFLTNCISGIINSSAKGSNRISSVSKKESTKEFLHPLLDIVNPKIVIAMGSEAYECVSNAFQIPRVKTLQQAVEHSPYELPGSKFLYPVFHCGGLGLVNRSFEKQINDWMKIGRKGL
jgi:hypothetical protein